MPSCRGNLNPEREVDDPEAILALERRQLPIRTFLLADMRGAHATERAICRKGSCLNGTRCVVDLMTKSGLLPASSCTCCRSYWAFNATLLPTVA